MATHIDELLNSIRGPEIFEYGALDSLRKIENVIQRFALYQVERLMPSKRS